MTPKAYAHKFKPYAQMNWQYSVPTIFARQDGLSNTFGPENNPQSPQAKYTYTREL